MAGGIWAYLSKLACDRGYLMLTTEDSTDIKIRLNNMSEHTLSMGHVLPQHPSGVGDDVVVIAGSLKGQVCKVLGVEDDSFLIGELWSRDHANVVRMTWS
jgi:hypothetical protein